MNKEIAIFTVSSLGAIAVVNMILAAQPQSYSAIEILGYSSLGVIFGVCATLIFMPSRDGGVKEFKVKSSQRAVGRKARRAEKMGESESFSRPNGQRPLNLAPVSTSFQPLRCQHY